MKRSTQKALALGLAAAVFATVYTGLSASTAASSENLFNPGTYTGVSVGGYGGPITVSAVFDENSIVSIEVTDHSETFGIGNISMDKTITRILEAQSTRVDIVAGATLTSLGVISAVNNAILEAGGDPGVMPIVSAEPDPLPDIITADVVVVGGGMSGLVAAIAAAEEGASVILLEKMPFLGGSTLVSLSTILTVGSQWQYEHDVHLTARYLTDRNIEQQLLNPGPPPHEVYCEDLFLAYMERSGPNFDWLISHGYQPGAPMAPIGRNIRALPPEDLPPGAILGPVLVDFLEDTARDLGVTIYLNARGSELIQCDDGAIVGIIAQMSGEDVMFEANNGVILATGGFIMNAELVERFIPNVLPYFNFNVAPSSHAGDGHLMAEAVGAVFFDHMWPQGGGVTARAGELDGILGYDITPGIMVNHDGLRYVRENWPDGLGGFLTYYTVSFNFTLQYAPEGAIVIFDSGEAFEARVAATEASLDRAGVYRADTIAELAEALGVPVENLQTEVDEFNAVTRGEATDRLGREHDLYELVTGPFYAVRVYPMNVGTLGGIQVNDDYQVIDACGNVIPGLFAVGEMSGRRLKAPMYISGLNLSIALDGGIVAGRVAAAK